MTFLPISIGGSPPTSDKPAGGTPATPTAPTTPAPVATPEPGDLLEREDGTDDVAGDGGEGSDPVPAATGDQPAEPVDGVPDDPSGYVAPEISTGWNQDALNPIFEAAHRHGVSQEAVADALQAYATQLEERQADRRRQDKEAMAQVRRSLTASERASIDAAGSAMSPELRGKLRGARFESGEPVLANPEFLALIGGLHARPTPSGPSNTAVARAQRDAVREQETLAAPKYDYHRYMALGLDKELAAIRHRRGER